MTSGELDHVQNADALRQVLQTITPYVPFAVVSAHFGWDELSMKRNATNTPDRFLFENGTNIELHRAGRSLEIKSISLRVE